MIQFEDVAHASGIRFEWKPRSERPLRILDTFGAGCAFLDFDADGHLDVLLVGDPVCGLFLNRGGLQFSDISTASGLGAHKGEWKGCAIADYDGDGFPDILLSGYRKLRLLHNERGRIVQDVTAAAGLPPDNRREWGSSAGFMDLDGDADLDLVLTNYVVFNSGTPQLCELTPGVKSGCPPQTYQPERPRLYRNQGKRFADGSKDAGFTQTNGKGLALGFCDYDQDGRIDLYIGNDGTPADLMRNEGDLVFRNAGVESGAAYGVIPGQAIAAMGVDWADYDRDGLFDFAVSAFENEAYSVQKNEGQGFFRNVSAELALVDATFRPLGFATMWLDADNDGYPELFFANGHVYDNVEQIYNGSTFHQPMMLFHNSRGKRLVDIAPALGGVWKRSILGRGSAKGDFDGDGRIDLLVVDYDGKPLLLHNRSETRNHWLEVRVRGGGGNRHGYGVQVTARAGREQWVSHISPSASYLSTSAASAHLGLGKVSRLDRLTLRWPTGKTVTLTDVKADQILEVSEGRGALRSRP